MKLQTESDLVNFLNDLNYVNFAFIFGSFIHNKMSYASDVDFALYFTKSPTALEIGEIVLGLEKIINNKVDIVSLNDLYISNPGLAYKIISEGKLLFSKDKHIFTEFKKSVILHYLDFKPIIEKFNSDFNIRLSSNKFAVFEK